MRVCDLVSISRAPAVVSLSDVERLRDDLCAGREATGGAGLKPAATQLTALVSEYSLAEAETRAAFEAMIRSLGRQEERGDAFHIQGMYGTGKSHLLAVLALLCGHPEQAWPVFLDSHPEYEPAAEGFRKRRLVVAIPLDEYSAPTHPLEYVVLSRIEAELAARHGTRVALTEEWHLFDLVDRYVLPQIGDSLNEAAQAAHGVGWEVLRGQSTREAAALALEFLASAKFPLDWRRSRAEAWAELGRALEARGIDGPVVLVDELGTFLASKDRAGLNADASFLQYLAQRTATARCWLICVTQRGLEEVGDIDRRTLRQLRGRFRAGFTLDLADLEWVVEHRLVRKREVDGLREVGERLRSEYPGAEGEAPFSTAELARSYPINPRCLQAIRHAAEISLSRTRSVVRMLQEAAAERGWLEQPAERLITPDRAFDLFRDEMALSASGRQHLHAYEVVMANAGRVAPGRERQLGMVMKALCFLGLGELRWSAGQLRASLVGCDEEELWRSPEALCELLLALYRRGSYVERSRGEGGEADAYYVDVSSDVAERIRERLAELVAGLAPEDGRVTAAALEACREASFPLAAMAEPRSLPVMWSHSRRYVTVVCRDLCGLTRKELENLAAALASPQTKEDGWLFLASPTADPARQAEAWRELGDGLEGRFAPGLLIWLPAELSEAEREHLVEHTAIASMVADRTLGRRQDREFREKVRERWADSEAEVGRMLRRAYHEGRIFGVGGQEAIERERLWALFGDWEETLAAVFAGPFREMFPRFLSIAPERRLAGRAQTNQIIAQFIRSGEVTLPPASTLEAHLIACAAPLGLVEGEGRHLRLALKNRDLVEAAIAAAPPRSGGDSIDPHEAVSYGEFVGRLAKSEWGLVREQSELLAAALIKTGYLVGLDAFLQPVRLEAVAAPLGENLPSVMRGTALRGRVAETARVLWRAAAGERAGEWDLPMQERAWGEMIAWAARLSAGAEERRAAMERAAELFGHHPEDWSWADEALGRAEALARTVESALTSREGLTKLATAAERLPGDLEGTAHLLAGWRECERFLREEFGQLARLYQLLADPRVQMPEDSLLARQRRSVLDSFSSPARLVSDPAEAKAAARRWLEAYRRHYLAWHARAHAAGNWEDLAGLRRSAPLEAGRRLARAGLETEAVAVIEAELGRALAARCVTGDPLPVGSVVCPVCEIKLGEEMRRPESRDLLKRAEEVLTRQRGELLGQSELLQRRLSGCREEHIKRAMEKLLAVARDLSPEELCELLGDDVIAWLRHHLTRPQARRRELRALEDLLRGKEITKREVMQIVDKWLQAGEDEVVEIV